MKKILIFITAICISTIAIAHTINWHDGNQIISTTCDSGDTITPPTPIGKYGYHLKEWVEYRPIKYLEFTGGQNIDTNFIFTGNRSIVEIDFESLDNNGTLIATQTDSNHRWGSAEIVGYTISSGVGNVPATTMIGLSNSRKILQIDTDTTNNILTVTYDNKSATLHFGDDAHTGLKAIIGCKNTNGSLSGCFRGLIYNFKIYQDNILVRDFIPILDYNSTPCMYDKVEKKFYYNAGTGNFIAGPVVGSGGEN